MVEWLSVDWEKVFAPSVSPLEIFVRGTVTYLALFVLLRIFRRQAGTLGPADLLVLLLVADAAQNAMASSYESITDGLWLVLVIVGWEYLLDYLTFRFPSLGRFVDRPPLLLVENGRTIDKNLAKELITRDELLSLLRQQGISDLGHVDKSFLEGNGQVSVLSGNQQHTPPEKPIVLSDKGETNWGINGIGTVQSGNLGHSATLSQAETPKRE